MISLGVPGFRPPRAGAEVAWVTLGQVAYLGGLFAGMKLFTYWLPQAEYGRLALGLSLTGLAGLFTFGPVGQGILRYYSVHRESDTLSLYYRVTGEALALPSLLVGGLTLIAALTAGRLLGTDWGLVVLAAGALAVLAGLGDSLGALATAQRRRRLAALYQGAGAWLRLACAAGLVALAGTSGHWVLAGYALGAGLSLIPLLLTLARDTGAAAAGRAPIDASGTPLRSARGEFWGYAFPFLLFAGFAAVSLYADRWVIQMGLGEVQVGLYFAVMQIASAPLTLFFGILSQAVQPVVFDRVGSGDGDALAAGTALLRRALALALAAMLPMLAVGFLADGPIIRLLTTPDYATVPGLLGIGMLSFALFYLGQLLAIQGLAMNRPRAYIWPKAVQALGFLALAPLFLSWWGLPGVAWALCASSALYLLSVLLVNRRLIAEASWA